MQFYKTVKRKRPICTDSGDSPGGLESSVCDERGSILGHRDGGVGKCARAASHKDTHTHTRTHTVVAVLFAYVWKAIVKCCV